MDFCCGLFDDVLKCFMGKISIFDNRKVRTHWNAEEQEWYFSVADVCSALSESASLDANAYWRKLKQRLIEEGSEVVTKCHGLKMKAADGKMRETDVMRTEDILRLIQSIPSKKAEPFKVWLAQVGKDRLDEIEDPELAMDRAIATYKKKGYSDEWIQRRMQSKEIRDDLVREWSSHGIDKPVEIAVLTDEILRTWSGKTTREYKEYKNLKKENLRDNMTRMELLLTMLGEEATKDYTKQYNPQGFAQNKNIAGQGGEVAYRARIQYEKGLGKSVVSKLNFKDAQKQITENQE